MSEPIPGASPVSREPSMSEPAPGAPPGFPESSESEPAEGGTPGLHRSRPEPRASSRWIAPVALLLAVIAVAVAVWALLRPAPAGSTVSPATSQPTAEVTSQQTADAKSRACNAFNMVNAALDTQTHIDLGGDPMAVQAVAVNARLSSAVSASYLLDRLDPATPPPLATAIRSFADNLQDFAINSMAGASGDDPAQAGRVSEGEAARTQVADLCK